MKKNVFLLIFTLLANLGLAQQIKGPIKVHEENRYFTDSEGQPFFWLADTAWELFHRLDLTDAELYLDKRKEQGFNVVQTVALAELDGLNTPNANGDKPFLDEQYSLPNEAYFQHMDKVINLALEKGIHIALLPTWGDKLFKANWGIGPEIFNQVTAYTYGKWIGNRYRNQKNIIWVIGGDRNPRKDSDDVEVWNAMAEGILESQNPENRQLITFHPQPASPGGSSNWFHEAEWLDFNMHQTGHCPDVATYKKISYDLALTPAKPTLDGEPLYEEHPKCFDADNQGYSEAADIRRIMYWNVFAGAAGQTYGCHAVWQMYDLENDPINAPLKPWNKSLDLEVANQVQHLKSLMLSEYYFDRIPDQSLIAEDQADNENYIIATRSKLGDYAFLYFPIGQKAELDLSNLKTNNQLTWYDPRTGVSIPYTLKIANSKKLEVIPPSSGRGNDWVLVIKSQD